MLSKLCIYMYPKIVSYHLFIRNCCKFASANFNQNLRLWALMEIQVLNLADICTVHSIRIIIV